MALWLGLRHPAHANPHNRQRCKRGGIQNTNTQNRILTSYGRIGQNVYLTGTIHCRNCTHPCLEITSTIPRCALVKSTTSRHIEKNETGNKNRKFHMKRKKISFINTRQKIAHFIWAKKVSFPFLGTPAATSTPAPTTTAVPQHPSPSARPGTTAGTHPRSTGTTIHRGPGSVAPPAPSARPRCPRPLPPDAPILQRSPPAASPPRPNVSCPDRPPTPSDALGHTTPSHVPQTQLPPPPALAAVPTSAVVPHTAARPSRHHHTVQHHLPPPLHTLATYRPPCAPIDTRGAFCTHQQHQGLQEAPHHHRQTTQLQPMPVCTVYQEPPPAYGPQH